MPGRGRGRPPYPDVLTPAEWRVINEVRTGATNAEIAIRLGLGITTIKFHIRNIRGKLELDDRSDLAAWHPEAEPKTTTRRWLLAPLGLLASFWKPAVATAALVVVGGAAIAAGVLAYAIVNSGEAASAPDEQMAPAPASAPIQSPPTEGGDAADTGGDSPAVVFWGDISENQQAAVRTRVAGIVEFFEERFRIRVPNVTIHVASDEDALEQALGRALDSETTVRLAHYAEGSIFVHATDATDGIERLYFEAFEDHIAGSRDLGPAWLREGAAVYAAHLFRDWRGEKTLADALSLARWAASYDDTPLEDLERQSPTEAELSGSETLSTATVAVEWLVGLAGEDALVAYYRALPGGGGWEEAFERAFGLSPQAAYEGIAAHRAAVLVVRRAISGVVLGPDGEPIQSPLLFVNAIYTNGAGSESVSVQSDGGFTVRPPDSTYRLSVSMVCPGSSGDLGWYEEQSGFTADETEATVIVVTGEAVSGIVIRLPALPNELLPECAGDGES